MMEDRRMMSVTPGQCQPAAATTTSLAATEVGPRQGATQQGIIAILIGLLKSQPQPAARQQIEPQHSKISSVTARGAAIAPAAGPAASLTIGLENTMVSSFRGKSANAGVFAGGERSQAIMIQAVADGTSNTLMAGAR
jgi:hypothetical protein